PLGGAGLRVHGDHRRGPRRSRPRRRTRHRAGRAHRSPDPRIAVHPAQLHLGSGHDARCGPGRHHHRRSRLLGRGLRPQAQAADRTDGRIRRFTDHLGGGLPVDPTDRRRRSRAGMTEERSAMRRGLSSAIGLVGASALIALAACTTDPSVQPSGEGGGGEGEASQEWFDQELYDTQLKQRDIEPEGPEDKPYLQMIDPEVVDTSEFESQSEKNIGVAYASSSIPRLQTGWLTMNEQLRELTDNRVIPAVETRDAQDNDDTQISDIDYFISEGDCDGFIISPNSTAAITPAVERACETDKPVIVFDRGVETDCAVTFIHPIGGFAWGIDSAEF